MARNVSEPEIDALLAREDEPRTPVVVRDFREPKRLSATDLESLQRPLDAAANAVLEAVRLVVPVEIVMEAIETGEASLDSLLREDATDIVGAFCESAAGSSVVALDAQSAVGLAEIALGGDENDAPTARVLTPLERALIDRLVVRLLERATQSLQIPAKETRPFANRTALSREVGSDGDRRRIAVRIPLVIGPTRLVIHLLLAGVKTPAPKNTASAPTVKDARKASIPAEIAPTKVDVCAVLARTDILLTELLALEAGDVITLDCGPGDAIAIEVEGQTRARARFGTRDGRLAVRIQEILRTKAP